MKKLLSAVIVLAMVLTLCLSLFSCTENDSASAGEATLTSAETVSSDLPEDSEIIDTIYQVFGYNARPADIYLDDRNEELYALYTTDYGAYVAYIVLYNDASEVSAFLYVYDSCGFVLDSYNLLTGYDTDWNRVDHAVRKTANHIATHYMTDDNITSLAREKFTSMYGECDRFEGHFIRENGVVVVFYNPQFESYLAYIDTFYNYSYNCGIRAFVAFNQDEHIIDFYLIGHNLTDILEYYPTEEEIHSFLYQYVSMNEDFIYSSKYLPDCYYACENFTIALDHAFYAIDDLNASWLERFIVDIFGRGVNTKLVVFSLIVIIAIVVIGTVGLILVGGIVLIIIIIIIIITVTKKKKKKKAAALKKEQSAPKAEAPIEEAKPQTAETNE